MAVRHLYLVRHAEPGDDGELTERGARQAELLGRRLSDVPLTSVLHGPLARAAATARLVAQQVACDPPVAALEAAGDYVPYVPAPGELDPQHEDVVRAFLADISPVEAEEGTALAAEAVRLLTGPSAERRTCTTWWSPTRSRSDTSSRVRVLLRSGGGWE